MQATTIITRAAHRHVVEAEVVGQVDDVLAPRIAAERREQALDPRDPRGGSAPGQRARCC